MLKMSNCCEKCKIYTNESPETALVREVREETGGEIEAIERLFTRELLLGPTRHDVIFFLAKLVGDPEAVKISREHSDFAWVTLEESKKYNLGVFHDVLDEIFKIGHNTEYDGGIVAFKVPDTVAEKIALNGYEEKESLHVSLAFIPYGELDRKEWLEKVYEAASKTGEPPLSGEIIGVKRFYDLVDSKFGKEDAFVALIDIPGIFGWRSIFQKYLGELNLFASEEHPFQPHITLAYIGKNEKNPVEFIEKFEIKFDGVSIWLGDDRHDVVFRDDDEVLLYDSQ